MSIHFEAFFKVVLRFEGGICDNPLDRGGLTKFGISSRANPDVDVAALDLEGAKNIYKTRYWDPIRADQIAQINPHLALCLFDFAVHSGPIRAIKTLQKCVKQRQDGIVGELTLKAVTTARKDVVTEFCAERVVFLATLASWRHFAKGWVRRVLQLSDENTIGRMT